MTLNGALSNALSGLNASARATINVSSNIANALTDGYGRRELTVESRITGSFGGVAITGTLRHVDPVILADRRLADAELGNASDLASFAARMETGIGLPGEAGSLSQVIADFDSALVTAASRPDSEERLGAVARSAEVLVNTINTIADGISSAREDADAKIGEMVDQLNTSLNRVVDLNKKISSAIHKGQDTSGFLDARQRTVDEISEMIPVHTVARERGAIAIYSTGGAILLEGTAIDVGFATTGKIEPQMTLAGGHLSGLTLNGRAVDASADSGALRGGRLGAQLQIRDETAPAMQATLDGLARDLAERFGPGNADSTITAGSAGMFTDWGSPFDPSFETGFASRMELNSSLAQDGGSLWKWRAGIGATTPGVVGDSGLLNGLKQALSTNALPSSSALPGVLSTPDILAAGLLSQVSSLRLGADDTLAYASSAQNTLKELERGQGVDTDYELQKLMEFENSYAANARVIQTVDEMLQAILNI
ncbi:flagellar hook-associated protein FlgK [Primorskyibacter marinus]|uniref:flagellar hook-associated protein FlgK n=1 Tax=Primorskyibacter marinus TaxID=1977320 RepID=UPI000E30B05F|nr:flagellar hook-associated protein FlgK [Primorskyibacter marinus]